MANLFKNYIFLFIFAGLLFAMGTLSLPPLKLPLLKLIIATALVFYLVFFLYKRLSRSIGVMFIVFLIEFVTISLISAGLILAQLRLINTGALSSVLGFTLWVRSVSALIGKYDIAYTNRLSRSPYIFALYLGLASFGIYVFASPIISDTLVSWLTSLASFTFGTLALVFAIISVAKAKKSKKIQEII